RRRFHLLPPVWCCDLASSAPGLRRTSTLRRTGFGSAVASRTTPRLTHGGTSPVPCLSAAMAEPGNDGGRPGAHLPPRAARSDQDAGAVSSRALTRSRERLAAGVLPTWLSSRVAVVLVRIGFGS